MQILDNKTDSVKIRVAAYAALVIPICIMFIKFFGTMITGSLSMQAALIDSISDIISSIFVILSIHISQKPENENYQFGFTKVESLGALVQSIFIFASGIFFIIEAYDNLFLKQEIRQTGVAILLITLSVTLLIILTQLQKYVIRKTDSLIIKSSFLHFHMDIFIDAGVLLSIFVSQYFGVFFIDSIFGILFTSYILSIAYRLLKQAINELVDKSFSQGDLLILRNIIAKYSDVSNIKRMLTRRAGGRRFIILVIAMDSDMNVATAYSIIDRIRGDVNREFKHAMLTIEIATA